ncbi:MAG: hypothetical protein AABX23_00385 [Nanoarchaeota archaeon]
MQEIYSKIKPEKVLHLIQRNDNKIEGRKCLIDPGEFLQIAFCGGLPVGHTFSGPHRHLDQERTINKTQESWVIINGSVEVTMYDLDDKIIEKATLYPGDCYMYFDGGHGFKLLEENTKFYEFKNGPYNGRSNDKVKIGSD